MTLQDAQAADPEPAGIGSAQVAKHRDASLAARIAENDADALRRVVDERTAMVFAIARRMTGSDADAEDIAQDVFLRLWQKPPDLSSGTASLATWLYRVTANRSIDWLRRRRLDPLDEALDVPATDAGPDAVTAGAQAARHVDAALSRLPDRQRLALVLTYYQGLSNIEAAVIMDTSVDALESLLARARRRLQKDLTDNWRELLDAASG